MKRLQTFSYRIPASANPNGKSQWVRAYKTACRGVIVQTTSSGFALVHEASGAMMINILPSVERGRIIAGALAGVSVDWTIPNSPALYNALADLPDWEIETISALLCKTEEAPPNRREMFRQAARGWSEYIAKWREENRVNR